MTRSKAAILATALFSIATLALFAWPGGAQAALVERVSVAADGTQAGAVSQETSISGDGRYVAFASSASNLVPGDSNGLTDVFVRDRQAGTVTLASVSSAEVQVDAGGAWSPVISDDGRYVAFVSLAHNLVPGDGPSYDVFLRDLVAGTTALVTVADDETPADGECRYPDISADGRYVVFDSNAANLVGGDTNNAYDIFVRDVTGGATTRVSVSDTEGEGDNSSYLASISADGRYVAFPSNATNLVTGDTNGYVDIFVRDITGGTTERVSVSTDGTQPDGVSVHPSISADGGYVAFNSYATDLVPGDANWYEDAFVRDLLAGTITRLSVSSGGTEGNGESADSRISADGSTVVFSSLARNLVASDTNGVGDIFVAANAQTISDSSIRGADRFDTAIKISLAMYPDTLPDGSGVVLAPGWESYQEALCGAPLAAAWGGPVLLSSKTVLYSGVAAELQRLAPDQVFLIGLSPAVATAVQTALPGAVVTSINGTLDNVYHMSYLVAKQLGTRVDATGGDISAATGIVTIGTNFPDAIGVSPLACYKQWPVLLTDYPDNRPMNAYALQAMNELGITSYVKAGTYTPDPAGIAGLSNFSGLDRYYTNQKVATWAKTNAGLTFAHTAFTTGDKFPDALAGGPYLAMDHGTLLLSPLNGPVPAPIGALLTANSAEVQHVTYIACVEPVIGQVKALLGSTVNLIFMHHSCGSNWLNDGLCAALNAADYHVADTTYGWTGGGSQAYGDHTDTADWPSWFNNTVMPLVYAEMDAMSAPNTLAAGPGENTVIMFKSCYPCSDVGSSITDEQAIYNGLLPYFQAHPDKMFVLITPPPMISISYPLKTRELCNWLTDRDTGWLAGLTTGNVFVFDFYNVLTHPDAHHRLEGGVEVHDVVPGANTLYYDSSGDNHPNSTGNVKATTEYVPLLNKWYQEFAASR